MVPVHLDLGFRIFPFYEGMYFLIAIVTAVLWAQARIRNRGLDQGLFGDALIWVLVGAVLGARSLHFLFWDSERFFRDPWVFFRIWEGGLTIVGGLAGGIAAGAFFLIRRRVDFWVYFAVVSPALLLGQALGRIGCFLNGDAWGTPTDLPWGVALPKFGTLIPSLTEDPSRVSMAWDWAWRHGLVDGGSVVTPPLHPTQLYEALADLGLMVLILWLSRSGTQAHPSRIFWWHVGGYALIRFLVEFVHGDHETVDVAGMTFLQVGLAAVTLVSAVALLRTSRLPR